MKRLKTLLPCTMAILVFLVSLSACKREPVHVTIHDKGAVGNTFENLMNGGQIACDKENIYYTSIDETVRPLRFQLFTSDLKGANQSLLLDVDATSLNVLDGWIYYENIDIDTQDYLGIYKVDVWGNNNQKISDVESSTIYVQDDILYALGRTEANQYKLYTMTLNGDNVKLVSNQSIDLFYLYHDTIYYTEYAPDNHSPHIGRMSLSGENQSVIAECYGGISWFTIYNDNIYYVDSKKSLFTISLTGQNQQKIIEMGDVRPSTFNVYQNKLYYTTVDPYLFGFRTTLHIFDMDTNKREKKHIPFQNRTGDVFFINDYIIGDKLFRNENLKFFVMNLDGSNIQPFPQ